jgi:hypothetical protein
MSRIAVAASAALRSVTTLNSCGSQRWSMTSTPKPSSFSQIVRYGRPSIFTPRSPFLASPRVKGRGVDITVGERTELSRRHA